MTVDPGRVWQSPTTAGREVVADALVTDISEEYRPIELAYGRPGYQERDRKIHEARVRKAEAALAKLR